jgi:hypothetical protein
MAIPTLTCKPRVMSWWGTRCILTPLVAEFVVFDMCNLGKVQADCAKHLTLARNRHRTALRDPSPSLTCQFLIDHACHFSG